MGCAVACLAARIGVDYDIALDYFDHPSLAWTRGVYCHELVEALRRAGYAYSFQEYDEVSHLEFMQRENVIVFVGPCEGYPAGHYLLRQEGGWMNSWSNSPRIHPIEARVEPELPGPALYVLFET
jgi:hypothetical protein